VALRFIGVRSEAVETVISVFGRLAHKSLNGLLRNRVAEKVRGMVEHSNLFRWLTRPGRYLMRALDDRYWLEDAIEKEALLREMLRLEPYVTRVLADRYWLEDALEHRNEVVAFLENKRLEIAKSGFGEEFGRFVALAGQAPRLPVRAEDMNPHLSDRASSTPIDRHYTYHPAWAARVLARTRPEKHVDISSIVSFSTIISAFVPVEFYDFRPAPIEIDGLLAGAADLTKLSFADDSIESLSCMHVIEHIGLGRYADPLDPDGDLKAISELVRVLAPGGNLLVATPVGRPRVEFNAHRVYDHEAFARYFAPLQLVEFSLIEEHGNGGLILNPPAEVVRAESYACGCFWFRKLAAEELAQAGPATSGS
jgi:SAM-dependent methyltransferase